MTVEGKYLMMGLTDSEVIVLDDGTLVGSSEAIDLVKSKLTALGIGVTEDTKIYCG